MNPLLVKMQYSHKAKMMKKLLVLLMAISLPSFAQNWRGGGSMTYPDAGLAVSTGSAWDTSITLGTGWPAALAVAYPTFPNLDSTGAALGAEVYWYDSTHLYTLAPNTTATKKFKCETGTGSAGAAPTWCVLALTDIPAQAADTILENATGGSASPTAVAIPDCPDTGGNHLNRSTSTHAWSCGTSSASTNAATTLWTSGAAASAPDTSEDTLATITVPALHANDSIEVHLEFSRTGSSNTATVKGYFGGGPGVGTAYLNHGMGASTSAYTSRMVVRNSNATNAQGGREDGISSAAGVYVTAPTTSSIDTTSPTTIVITCTRATGDTCTLVGGRAILYSTGN